jgi:Asp-tRNA(Asn)/Glu-tRNA(Gln) amidotransferase A subunit family amidase
MLLLWQSIGFPIGRAESFVLGAPNPVPEVEPAMETAFRNALSAIQNAGVSIQSVDIAGMLARLAAENTTVMFYEGARFHEQSFKEYGARLADLADLVRDGLRIPEGRYDEARRYIAECRDRVAEMYKTTPVILVPAATGPAPLGFSSTGDPRMNSPWTALGTPAISIPLPVGNGLPLGLQLTADHGHDARLLRTAVLLHRVVNGK